MRFFEINQYGLSGTNCNAIIVKIGNAAQIKAIERHCKNVPNTNCVKMPMITHVVPVAVNVPRYFASVISATYVNTYKKKTMGIVDSISFAQ